MTSFIKTPIFLTKNRNISFLVKKQEYFLSVKHNFFSNHMYLKSKTICYFKDQVVLHTWRCGHDQVFWSEPNF